jgi:transposase
VELVTQKDYIIAKAARRLGIKASTARMIINKFKQTGTYPMKKFRRPASRTPQASEQHPCISYPVEDENIL